MRRIVATILILAFVAAPAASIAGSKQIRFDSNPQGATIFIDNVKVGVTPVATEVAGRWWYENNSSHVIKAQKEGYRTVVTTFKASQPNIGGIICGFLCLFPFLWAIETPDVLVIDLQEK